MCRNPGTIDRCVGGLAWQLLIALICAAPALANTFPPELELESLLLENGGDGSEGVVIWGARSKEFTAEGGALTLAGDVNGDGLPDLLIGVPSADVGERDAGSAYILFGRQDGFPIEFGLEQLQPTDGGDGSLGFVIVGSQEDGRLGSSVAAGDVNGDGLSDVVVGAPGNGVNDDGHVYVVYGRDTAVGGDFPPRIRADSLLPANGGDGSVGIVLTGEPDDDVGRWVAADGDINGDGRDDVATGGRLSALPVVSVVFGPSRGARFPPQFELAQLRPSGGGDGRAGFILLSLEFVGLSPVAFGGDIDADGRDDLLLAAESATPFNRFQAGMVFALSGRDGMAGLAFEPLETLDRLFPRFGGDGSGGFVMSGTNAEDGAGRSISFVGDVNGDSLDDLMVGTERSSEVYVLYGRHAGSDGPFPGQFALAGLRREPAAGARAAGFTLQGAQSARVSGAGDINADGVDDILIGTVDNVARPAAYVVFGRDTAVSGEFPGRFELASLIANNGGDGSQGFIVRGLEAGDDAGDAVAGVGDVNGDGIDDLAVATPGLDRTGSQSSEGAVFIIYGRAD